MGGGVAALADGMEDVRELGAQKAVVFQPADEGELVVLRSDVNPCTGGGFLE